MACTADMIQQQQQQQQQQQHGNNGQNSNVFYLDSITLNQFNDNTSTIVMSSSPQHQSQQQQFNSQPPSTQQDHQQGSPFGQNDGLFYDSSQSLTLNTMPTESFLKTDLPGLYQQHQTQNNGQQHLSNSSHCTTPQTPSSIPDIILTGKQ